MRILLITGEGSGARIARTVPCVVCVAEKRGDAPKALAALDARFGVDVKSDDFAKEAEGYDILLSFRSKSILPEPLLKAPKVGAFNLHTGPLPEYAGLNVASWAICNGETEHGVTLHWMEAGIDTGPIAFESRFPIEPDETGLSLTSKCIREGERLVKRLLEGEIPKTPQDLSKRQYYGKGPPALDLSKSAVEIDRLVRASNFHPFPSDWGTPSVLIDGKEVPLLQTEVLPQDTEVLPQGKVIPTGDGYIRILE